jgi:hypothetical protein
VRLVIFALLFGSLAVACGGGDDSDADSSAPATVIDAADLNEKASQQLGSQVAFEAVVYAFERRYSVQQVAAAIDGSGLAADGKIDGVEPGGPALGLVVLPENAVLGGRDVILISMAQQPPYSIDEVKDRADAVREQENELTVLLGKGLDLQDQKQSNLYMIMLMAEAGLTGDEILEYVILGPEAAAQTARDKLRAYADELELSDQDSVTSEDKTGEPRQSEAGDPAGIYSGTLTLVQCGANCDVQCEIQRPYKVTVNADGTIRANTPAQAIFTYDTPPTCLDPTEQGWVGSGTWTPEGVVSIELQSFPDTPTLVVGDLKQGVLTLSLEEDTRVDDPGRVIQFDAVLTRE